MIFLVLTPLLPLPPLKTFVSVKGEAEVIACDCLVLVLSQNTEYWCMLSQNTDTIIFYKHRSIPHICYFLYTGKISQAKILHPKARKLRQIEFRDKMA